MVQENKDEIIVLSPAAGMFRRKFENDDFLSNKAYIGDITILNIDYRVFLPENISGNINFRDENRIFIPVGYKEKLFSIKDHGPIKKTKTRPLNKVDDLIEDGFIIKAFTTGIFYRRLTPESPPFVEEGSVIKRGELLGLIEVMKSFNQIIFSEKSGIDTGIIKKIMVEDSKEVRFGDPLFLVLKDHGGKK